MVRTALFASNESSWQTGFPYTSLEPCPNKLSRMALGRKGKKVDWLDQSWTRLRGVDLFSFSIKGLASQSPYSK